MTTNLKTIRPQALREAADGLIYMAGVPIDCTVTYKQFAQGIGFILPLYSNELSDVLDLMSATHGGRELVARIVRADTQKPGVGFYGRAGRIVQVTV